MAPQILYILFEHATGYALFQVKEFEEIGLLLPQVEKSVTDLSRFNSILSLVSFSPFRSAANALDNINCISEGIIHPDLKAFLQANVLQGSKKIKNVIGLADSKLSVSISEELGFSCLHSGPVPEIIRGIRLHAPKLIKGLTDVSQSKAQLGLGHSYSRAKVKFNVNRTDNMIIQSINLLDQLDKNINTFSMRIREWYGYHFPELVRIINDNQTYARVVTYIGNRKEFTEAKLEGLKEIVMDDAKAKAIWDASRSSMGMDISPMDMINVEIFAKKVVNLAEYRIHQHNYLKNKMDQVAPNLSSLIGEQVGARLISHAGSLTNLAKYPASTVQILGAEKALFRALKTRGNTPKYGLIFHSTFIGRAAAKNKGRISRNLANKCSIASRIDCFSEFPTKIFGDHLKEQVEERLKFYDSGEAPRKNVDVMKIAVDEAHKAQKKFAKKKRKSEMQENINENIDEENNVVAIEKPKKKKKKSEASENVTESVSEKKKKRKSEILESEKSTINGETGNGEIKKKKKKDKLNKTQ